MKMAKYPLTDRQKDLIRSLAPGLRDGTIRTEWIIFYGDGKILGVGGMSVEVWNTWDGVKYADFDVFVNCDFFNRTPQGGYTLNEALILDAVDHDFEVNDWVKGQGNQYNLSNISGSNINIESRLDNVQQSIGTATPLSDDAKEQLTELIEQLKEALSAVPEDEAEEAEVLAHHAQVAVEQLNSGKPNKKLLSISVDGLEKAAENVGRIAPRIVKIAAAIAAILRPFTM
jgi:hypothetical protein